MRLSDLRFPVVWLLPVLSVCSVGFLPVHAASWTVAIWLGIALIDAFMPGGKRSPAAVTPYTRMTYFNAFLRMYVLLQMVLIAGGAFAAIHSD